MREKFKEGQGRMCCNVLRFAALAYTGPQQETAGHCLRGLKQQAGAVTAVSSTQARCDKGGACDQSKGELQQGCPDR